MTVQDYIEAAQWLYNMYIGSGDWSYIEQYNEVLALIDQAEA